MKTTFHPVPWRGALFALLLSCTPQQGQVIVKTVDDAIKCVATQIAMNPEPPPLQIAATCGVTLTPDVQTLISTLDAARKNPSCTIVTTGGDAGAKGPGI